MRDALRWLHGLEGETTLTRIIRRRVPSLKPAQIQSALGRVTVSFTGPARTVRPASEARTAPAVEEPTKREHPSPTRYEVSLAQLIAAGLIRPPVPLERLYKGRTLHAGKEHA